MVSMAKPSRKPPGFRKRRLELHQLGCSGGEIALAKIGIRTFDAFLSSVQTIRDRMLLSARTGLTSRQIRNMTALLEFQQLTGFDAAVVQRLQAIGVGTVVDLANQDPRELANRLSKARRIQTGKTSCVCSRSGSQRRKIKSLH